MKLSEFSTDEAINVICEITPYVANITSDKRLLDGIKSGINQSDNMADMYVQVASKISDIIPILLRDHKMDVFGVLAAINRTSVDSILSQKLVVTMKQIKDAVMDGELVDFFKSLQQADQNE